MGVAPRENLLGCERRKVCSIAYAAVLQEQLRERAMSGQTAQPGLESGVNLVPGFVKGTYDEATT